MISNELLEEVINVSNRKQFISKGLLLRIAINVIENSNYLTKSKFEEIKFVDLEFGLAACYRSQGIIEVDYNKLINRAKEKSSISFLSANLLIIQAVLHEIEHLNELYKITKKGLQANLLNVCSERFTDTMWEQKASKVSKNPSKINEYINNSIQKLNENYWWIIPAERIAEVDSYNNLLQSLNLYPNFRSEYSKDYFLVLKNYLSALKMGYNYDQIKFKYNTPLIDYLRVIDHYVVLEDLGLTFKPCSNGLSKLKEQFLIEERMKFGLFITDEDIKELNRQKIKLKSAK